MFLVNGKMVNFAGEPVDQDGKVIVAEQPASVGALISGNVIELQNQLNRLTQLLADRDKVIEDGSADNKRLIAQAGNSNENSFRLKGELDQAKARITELEGQLQASQDQGNPDSADTRTNAELRAALDAKGVQYDAKLNKAALQALAAEHSA